MGFNSAFKGLILSSIFFSFMHFFTCMPTWEGREILVGIATGYRLYSSRFDIRWGKTFISSPHTSRPSLEPIQSRVKWALGLEDGSYCFRGVKLAINHHLSPKLRMSRAVHLVLTPCLRGKLWGDLYFYMYSTLNIWYVGFWNRL